MTAVALALRLGRWGIAGFGGLALFLTLVNAAAFNQVAGHTAADRAAFGRSMTILASQFSVILPPPIRPDTLGGYVEFRAYGALAVVFAIWALVSASGAARGDEERGVVDAVLATGLSRTRWIAARMAGFVIGGLAAALLATAGVVVGAASGGESIDLRAALEAGMALTALGLACSALTLFIAQLASARTATALAGTILLALFLVNSLGRTFTWLAPWRLVSPFRYWEMSRSLSPGGHFDLRATLVLLSMAIVFGALATIAFAYRDQGSPLVSLPAPARAPTFDPSPAIVWRIPVVRHLWEGRLSLVVWTAGVAALGALFVVLTKTIVGPLLDIPALKLYFSFFLRGSLYPSFLGFIWLGFAQLLLAGFAITQVARWSAEDTDGRLELILSNPVSRVRVLLERATVLAVAVLVIATVSGIAVGVESHNQAIDVDRTHLTEASLLLVPFTLIFAAVGSILASWVPRATAGVLGGFAIASYLMTQLGPIFKLPTWVQDLSAFKLYGQPLTDGIDGTGLAIMLLIVITGFGASMVLIQRRDIGA